MAVTNCAYDRGAATASLDETGIGTYTLGWIVETDGIMAPGAVVNGALLGSPHPVPSQWTSYSYQGSTDAWSFSRDYSCVQDPKSVKLYYITVGYRPLEPGDAPTDSGQPIKSEPNPVERPPVIWRDREVFNVRKFKDIEDNDILNKCGGLYPDPIDIEEARGILVMEFNVSTFAETCDLCDTFDGAVNSTPWNINGKTYPARAAHCREVSSSPPQTEQGYRFYHIVMRFSTRSTQGAWDYLTLEQGSYHFTKTGDEIDQALSGPAITVPDEGGYVKLNEDGTYRDPTLPAIETKWRIRKEENFNTIPIQG